MGVHLKTNLKKLFQIHLEHIEHFEHIYSIINELGKLLLASSKQKETFVRSVQCVNACLKFAIDIEWALRVVGWHWHGILSGNFSMLLTCRS